jgi:hypothetical protein
MKKMIFAALIVMLTAGALLAVNFTNLKLNLKNKLTNDVVANTPPTQPKDEATPPNPALEKIANLDATSMLVESKHDFGKIKKDVPVTYTFEVKNNGNAPLVLADVKASCGCTTADFTKTPIAPGQVGFVKAQYNAKNTGAFTKTVTVTANTTPNTTVLTLSGEVIE